MRECDDYDVETFPMSFLSSFNNTLKSWRKTRTEMEIEFN